MARGENPGQVLSIATTLTYSATTDFGHASAGKDLMLSLITTGTNAGKAQLAADGEKVIGKFLELDKDGVASYMIEGFPMIMRKTAADITVGSQVVGGGSGKVKQGLTTAAGLAVARGLVTEILETGDNGRIKVLLPA